MCYSNIEHHDRMVAVANKQQFKIKVYKKQIEEAGDIIAFILGG